MTSKLMMLIALGAIAGTAAGYGALDTQINAFVQQFGATDHEVFETPGQVHNVQIDWLFATTQGNDAYLEITHCDLTFDKVVPAGTTVICHISGHDDDPTDGILNPGPSIGTGQTLVTADTRSVQVPISCDMGEGSGPCDVQDIEDVKVILVGKETTNVVLEETGIVGEGICADGLDNDFDGNADELDDGCVEPQAPSQT